MTMMPQEQQVRQLVRETLNQAGQIENGRLAQLMPAIPKKKRPFWQELIAQPLVSQLAVAGMMFVLLLGGWHWFNNDGNAVWQMSPTHVAVTATTTNTPTATQTEAKIVATETAVSQQAAPAIIQTPAPQPTPVAAIPINRILSN
ncbi:MAG: hypothetical protein DHS20C20_13470 [Ardenticatenaceae bacterium]|nr:MAG: hypothetical protein DHS20C20_13470 [Ardenticatenaceae bacterium]